MAGRLFCGPPPICLKPYAYAERQRIPPDRLDAAVRNSLWYITTYGELAGRAAARMGRESMSSQAVGGAVGHNPISIIIPCHRVVGMNGSLTGYAGGIKNKIKLLELEGADLSHLFVPKKGAAF